MLFRSKRRGVFRKECAGQILLGGEKRTGQYFRMRDRKRHEVMFLVVFLFLGKRDAARLRCCNTGSTWFDKRAAVRPFGQTAAVVKKGRAVITLTGHGGTTKRRVQVDLVHEYQPSRASNARRVDKREREIEQRGGGGDGKVSPRLFVSQGALKRREFQSEFLWH